MHRFLWLCCLLVVVVGAQLVAPARTLAHDEHPADYPYPHVHSLVRDPADPQHIFALGNPEAYESFDGGQTWQVRGGGVPTAHYARLLFEPVSGQLFAYTPGIAGFHRSVDSGWSWPQQTDLLLRDVIVRHTGSMVELLAVTHDLRFVASHDGGVSWAERAAPWAGAGDARLIRLADAPEVLLAVAGGATYRSADAGQSWERFASWPAELTPVRLYPAADRRAVYAIAHHGQFDSRPVGNTLLRSLDEGRSWQLASAPLMGSDLWAAIGARGDRVVAATWRGDVWYVEDGNWAGVDVWRRWPLALVQPIHLREDVNPTPTVTDLLPGPHGELVVSTVLGMYRAEQAGLALELRSRGLVPTAALLTASVAGAQNHPDHRHFPQTGHMLGAPFRAAWERLGGLPTLGYPITEPYLERNIETGADLRVQLFERGRLEQHLDGQVMAARIVAETQPIAPPVAPQPGCLYSAPTGHTICGELLRAWRSFGAEGWLGLPLDEARLDADLRVQLFERGRLEQRLDRPDAIMLGLVGREEAQRRGWLP